MPKPRRASPARPPPKSRAAREPRNLRATTLQAPGASPRGAPGPPREGSAGVAEARRARGRLATEGSPSPRGERRRTRPRAKGRRRRGRGRFPTTRRTRRRAEPRAGRRDLDARSRPRRRAHPPGLSRLRQRDPQVLGSPSRAPRPRRAEPSAADTKRAPREPRLRVRRESPAPDEPRNDLVPPRSNAIRRAKASRARTPRDEPRRRDVRRRRAARVRNESPRKTVSFRTIRTFRRTIRRTIRTRLRLRSFP